MHKISDRYQVLYIIVRYCIELHAFEDELRRFRPVTKPVRHYGHAIQT